MKKILGFILTFVIMISSFGTTVYAQETDYMSNTDYAKFIENIEAANQKIDFQIEMAIEEADDLIIKYQNALLKNMQYMNAKDFEYYLRTVKNTVTMLSDSGCRSDEVAKKLSDLYDKIDMLQNKISSNPNMETYLTAKDDRAVEETQILTAEFEKNLNSIIVNLINNTNEIVQKLIVDGQKAGIEIKSVWIKVEIGGSIVLVDPCRTRSL
jgi:peptidoglycan hydrolase CwlO-like protein